MDSVYQSHELRNDYNTGRFIVSIIIDYFANEVTNTLRVSLSCILDKM